MVETALRDLELFTQVPEYGSLAFQLTERAFPNVALPLADVLQALFSRREGCIGGSLRLAGYGGHR